MMRKLIILAILFGAAPSICLAIASAAAAQTSPATAGVRIVVPAHDIARGQTISDSDLTYATIQGGALMNGTVTSFDAVKNMEARRMLHAGETMRADDVRRPVVVTKGQSITMIFEAPGVQLTTMGRAMSEGGIGDTITVQNPVSFRMITAIVTAAGTVRAAGATASSPLIASNNRSIAR